MNQKQAEKKENRKFKTLLIFPPQWTPQNPHFAMTTLAGNLRRAGYEVAIKDLNVEFYDSVLTPEHIIHTKNKIGLEYQFLLTQTRLKSLINDNSIEFQLQAMRLMAIDKFFEENAELIEQLPGAILDAKETLRDPRRFYNPSLLVDAFFMIDKALEFISLPYHPAKITFNDFEQPDMLLATADIIRHAKTKKSNMFYSFFENQVSDILKEEANLIGISINSFSQILPGLTLAGLLKERVPEGTIINVGGNFFMRVKDALMKRPEFFENFCHCLSMGEGEKQVVTLADAVRDGKGFEEVPDVLWYEPGKEDEKGTVHYTFPQIPARLDEGAFQDLAGLPFEKYFSPEIVLCLQSSKGCYWGKCSFCDTDYGIKHDIKSLEHLIEEIKYLRDNYGVKNFEFIDESIRPSYMSDMADRFIKEDLGVHWFSNGRIEEAFTADLLNRLHESGLTLVLWGLESGSDRILDLINKGTDNQKRFEILRDSHNAGIWNFAYIFFGFPTETREEAMETINAIVNHKDIIDSYGRSVFTLGKHSLLFREKEKYGIIGVIEDMEELSSNLHYVSDKGMKDDEIDEMMKECTRICADAYDYNLWYFLRYRENIHLYLSRYGKKYVRDYKVQQFHSSSLTTY